MGKPRPLGRLRHGVGALLGGRRRQRPVHRRRWHTRGPSSTSAASSANWMLLHPMPASSTTATVVRDLGNGILEFTRLSGVVERHAKNGLVEIRDNDGQVHWRLPEGTWITRHAEGDLEGRGFGWVLQLPTDVQGGPFLPGAGARGADPRSAFRWLGLSVQPADPCCRECRPRWFRLSTGGGWNGLHHQRPCCRGRGRHPARQPGRERRHAGCLHGRTDVRVPGPLDDDLHSCGWNHPGNLYGGHGVAV